MFTDALNKKRNRTIHQVSYLNTLLLWKTLKLKKFQKSALFLQKTPVEFVFACCSVQNEQKVLYNYSIFPFCSDIVCILTGHTCNAYTKYHKKTSSSLCFVLFPTVLNILTQTTILIYEFAVESEKIWLNITKTTVDNSPNSWWLHSS